MELRELRRLSAQHALSLNYIYKDFMISRALFSLQQYQDKLIMKGGTAINRVFIRDHMRFSDDIDFDFLYHKGPQEAIPPLKDIVSVTGLGFERPRVMSKTVRFDTFFTNPLGMKDKLMIDFRIIRKAQPHEKIVVQSGFAPAEASLLQVYTKETLLAHKLQCLLERKEGKDIYDTFYLLEKCTTSLSDKEYQQLSGRLTLTSPEIKYLGNSTNHYIVKPLRPEWPAFIDHLKQKLAATTVRSHTTPQQRR